MSTLQQVEEGTILSIPTDDQAIEYLLAGEWLLTNGRGSYASSTIAGCNTRAYHGILVGSLNPPINRVMALSNCLEMIISNGRIYNISTFEFADKFAPAGYGLLKRFRQDIGVHYDYETENVELTKSVYLLRNTDTAVIVYDFTGLREPVEFVSRPFVGLRDFHTLQKSFATMYSRWVGAQSGGLLVGYKAPGSCELLLKCSAATFVKDKQWWFNFVYRKDKERGQAFTEDLWTPGFFKCHINSPTRIVLTARLADCMERIANIAETEPCDSDFVDKLTKDLWRHQEGLKRKARAVKRDLHFPITDYQLKNSNLDTSNSRLFEILCVAADAFVTERQTQTNPGTTIVAGYPWFADWSRDAFISLPGLLLATGRFEEAKSVLTTFAGAADMGMIPNCFDDRNETAYFNSVDASLWFINAAFQYLNAGGDSATFAKQLLPTIQWIIDSYKRGTRFGIRADDDGLITAGDEKTQLTWMDAKCDGITFTPRFGKAVEVNALWYNCLMQIKNLELRSCIEGVPPSNRGQSLPRACRGDARDTTEFYGSLAERVRTSFCRLFWNKDRKHLNDCILPDGSVDESLRPNQIFAVSLEFSPLPQEQQKSVVNAVQSQLLTPYGLRTLDPQSENYKGRYEGSLYERDSAYHQGTVWPYLIGAFVEAYLKVNDFSPESKTKAAGFILPLLGHLTETGGLGSISEIFDGDAPQKPKGCFAQAWSVAELIRAYRLASS